MKERIAWLSVVTLLVLGITWTLNRPAEVRIIPGETIHLEKVEAEDMANIPAALSSMEGYCGTQDLAAEVWVERTTAGLEVLGKCTATFRSGP
jgi:hypothetical protein